MPIKGMLIFLLMTTMMLPPLVANAGNSKAFYADCDTEAFTCMRVKRGQSWESLFPDDRDREIVMRINHRNGRLWTGLRIKVPRDLATADILDYSPFPHQIEPPQEKLVVFDPKRYAWAAYDPDGTLVRWGPATGGKAWCSDTNEACRTTSGRFRIFISGTSKCVSSKLPLPDGGAPMPYCMFFKGGEALHGSPGGVRREHASHGCVRMFVSDAEWMRYDFIDPPEEYNDYRGTAVLVLPYSPEKQTETS
tara:strand:- start:686 stop:1435 length:750 start_codon:yes stop_codon:yes gene_type:complete